LRSLQFSDASKKLSRSQNLDAKLLRSPKIPTVVGDDSPATFGNRRFQIRSYRGLKIRPPKIMILLLLTNTAEIIQQIADVGRTACRGENLEMETDRKPSQRLREHRG
jgi:hypothetical protein